MSVKIGKVGQVPNWIRENDWSLESRIKWMKNIMAFSPRDWTVNVESPGCPEPELWVLWCLINCNSKELALEEWNIFCKQYEG